MKNSTFKLIHIMKKSLLILLVILWSSPLIFAQEVPKTYMILNESKVHDLNLYKKNFPIIRNWWLKNTNQLVSNRASHSSEMGKIYSLIFISGEKNLGDYASQRLTLSKKISEELPEVIKSSRENEADAITRSTWVQIKNNTMLVPDFKIENYEFRKLLLFTVTSNKITEFESIIEEILKEEKAIGFNYNYIVYQAIEGYSNNTFMLLLPDNSRLDYYTHQTARNEKRKGIQKMTDLNQKASKLRNPIRIDYLTRIPNN